MRNLFLLSIFIFINVSFGQIAPKHKNYNQLDFEKNKIFDETYELWWYKNKWFPNEKDTLPYHVNVQKYKGIINYGVEIRSKNYRNFYFKEDKSICFLDVEFTNVSYNKKDSLINIEGFVSGGWDKIVTKGKYQNHIDIFIGEKKDSTNYLYLESAFNKDSVEVKRNNREIDEYAVLDTFPSFYLKNYSYFRTLSSGKRSFKISGKVHSNTLLTFGGRWCYSEIFDIGAMIYNPDKNKSNKQRNYKKTGCQQLIYNNQLVVDIEKQKDKKIPLYYQLTDKAEACILLRQYGKAKDYYQLLENNYTTFFSRDIHNAIRCAILARDLKTAFKWSEKMALKGVELPYFNSKIFTVMRKNMQWKNFSTKYDSVCKLIKSNRDSKLINELDNLVEEDQSNYGLKNRKDGKTLYETTERITSKLIDFLKAEGFPTEEKIGAFVRNDTTLISLPDFNVLIRHAIQVKPKNLATLTDLLDHSSNILDYDGRRSPVNTMPFNACYHIYKGDLYKSNSCNTNDLVERKIIFKFNNPNHFITVNNDYITAAYNKENPKEYDDYYNENFTFVVKLTDDWDFYEKN